MLTAQTLFNISADSELQLNMFYLSNNTKNGDLKTSIKECITLPQKKRIDLELGEFNLRHELHDKWEHIQKDNRESHLIEIIESRGGNIQYKHSKLTDKKKN